MKVEYIDHMGGDLRVINAAKVSFSKHADYIDEKGERLIHYLAGNGHWTPFSHVFATFRIRSSIAVARQLAKHQVGLAWNEVSRRYVDDEMTFDIPEDFRERAENVKQGSAKTTVESMATGCFGDGTWVGRPADIVERFCSLANRLYRDMVAAGVAPEQARMVMPVVAETEWYWSGSLAAWARVCNLRLDPHAQQETRDVAERLSEEMAKIAPISWEALVEYHPLNHGG